MPRLGSPASDLRWSRDDRLLAPSDPMAFGGGIAPVIAGFVAQHYSIQYIMHLAAIALGIGLVVALCLKETAPLKVGALSRQPA